MKSYAIEPTVTIYPFGWFGRAVSVHLFGAPTNWSIADLKDPEAELPEVYTLIDGVCSKLGVRTILAPRPATFNAQVCSSADLQAIFQGRNQTGDCEEGRSNMRGVRIMRGVDADGCDVPKGCAFWISSADCPLIIVWDPESGLLIVAHAGRDCLFDRAHLLEGKPARSHTSVVDAIIERFLKQGVKPANLRVFITCGIGACNFLHRTDDPKYGAQNRAIVAHFAEVLGRSTDTNDPLGQLDLQTIIKRQLVRHGVLEAHIGRDSIDTFGDRNEDSSFTWHSCARETTPQGKLLRNGVLFLNQ